MQIFIRFPNKYINMHSYRRQKTANLIRKPCQQNRTELNEMERLFFGPQSVEKAKNQYQSQYNRWENLRNQIRNFSIGDNNKNSQSLWKNQSSISKQASVLLQSNKPISKIVPRMQQTARHLESSQNCRKKTYKSKARPATSKHTQSVFKNPEETNLTFKTYRTPQRIKRKLFRVSINDMKKIQKFNMEGEEEIAFRKILFKKSLVVQTKMFAIEASFVHDSIVFTCEAMGQVFTKRKLAIGPSQLRQLSTFFEIFSTDALAEKLFEFLKLQNQSLKLDKEAIKKQLEPLLKKQKIQKQKPQRNQLKQSQMPIERGVHNQSKIVSDINQESMIKSKIAHNESKNEEAVQVERVPEKGQENNKD